MFHDNLFSFNKAKMKSFFLLVSMLFIIPYFSQAQLIKKKERENQDSLKTVRYFEYWDRDSLHLSAKGHFCNGKPCKRWKYFHYKGKRRMKVKYRDRLKIKYYNDKGRLTHKGYAYLDWNEQDTHFYWDGIWKYYDHKRRLYRKALFKKGDEIEVIMGPEDPIYVR
jgi:hypothetical protein